MTSDERTNLEIYVRDCSLDQASAWASTIFGLLSLEAHYDTTSIYHGFYGGKISPVVITTGVADGPFTGIWFSSGNTPWRGDVACARQAFAYFGREVRCDPGELGSSPYSDEFLSITADDEKIVVWYDSEPFSE